MGDKKDEGVEDRQLFLYLEPDELSDEEKKPRPRGIFVPFSLADEWYSVRIEDVLEVLKFQNITAVPGMPDFIMGIANIRGNIISVTDLNRFLSFAQAPITDETRIIIARAANKTTGLLVDSAERALNIPLDEIQPPLATIPKPNAEFIRGTVKAADGRLITILDMEKIISAPQMTFE